MDVSLVAATLHGCKSQQLDDPERLLGAINAACEVGGFTILHTHLHRFSPQGITATAVLSESHIALHSWPENGTLFIDLATCSGAEATSRAFDELCAWFQYKTVNRKDLGFATDDSGTVDDSTTPRLCPAA